MDRNRKISLLNIHEAYLILPVMTRFIVIFLAVHLQMNCIWGQHYKLDSLSLRTIENEKFTLRPYQHKLKVIAFLAIDCPLSQQSTSALREIRSKFSGKVSVIGVFPGKESRTAFVAFKKKYQLLFPLLSDKDYKWTKLLSATVTPEVFLLSEENDLLYHGAIDDRAISLSKRKRKADRNYLVDAIDDHLSGKETAINYIKAVGCYIEINRN